MKKSARHRNNRARWSIADLTFLEKNYRTVPVAEIAVRLGRTPGAVGLMAHKLGCRRKKGAPWSDAEMEIISRHYTQGAKAASLTALLPGRSVAAIFSMAEEMGVASGRFWQEEELRILKTEYPKLGTAVKEQLPGRNVMAIMVMANRLGLKKSRSSETGFRPWSDEDWALLEKNMHLSVADQQTLLFPDRTLRAVEKARGRLIKKQANKVY